MLLTVFYKSGIEKSFKNVTGIETGVCYDDETEKPIYEIRFACLGYDSTGVLRGIKAFEINDVNDTVFCENGIWRCAYCGAAFPAITKYEIDKYKWCPYCGRKLS